jgi:alkanesulfonate monooxygenase SsuD/methylene tetrahydromethanopterin reductase-like flavin-dependent oxidoreductase (luciferase family)
MDGARRPRRVRRFIVSVHAPSLRSRPANVPRGCRVPGRLCPSIGFHADCSARRTVGRCLFESESATHAGKLRRSQHFKRLVVRTPSQSEASIVDEFRASNLLGSADRLIERLRLYHAAGAQHVGLIFLGETTDELMDDMALFGETVRPIFAV